MNNFNVGDLLSRRANISPGLEACVEPERNCRLRYADIEKKANQSAHILGELGVSKGDRVGLLLPNCHEFIALMYGAAKLGAIIVPLNTRLTPAEAAYILADSGCSALFYAKEFTEVVTALKSNVELEVRSWIDIGESGSTAAADSLNAMFETAPEAVIPAVAAEDDALFIMYTSGTTGNPKGVVHTHGSALWAALTWISGVPIREADRFWAPFPMFHVAMISQIVMAVQRGLTLVVEKQFNPVTAWDVLEQEKINMGGGVPAMLNFMRQAPGFQTASVPHLRCLIGAAAPMPVELIESYKERGIEIIQAYGLTESAGGGTVLGCDYGVSKVGSIGKPMLYTEVRLADEEGLDVEPGQDGEILIRGPHVMKEYWNNPVATDETLVDGWLRTGDIAIQDEDGFFFIRDRLKDMIISGGENIYPAEVENVLMSHPGVLEAAVIGQPSEKWGESPYAVAVLADQDVTEGDLQAHCQDKLSRYKQPRGYTFVDAIPRNASGKILKRELRVMYPGPAAE